jgi:hypothetical protein
LTDSIIIHRRFQGPANSGNGGYVCGRLASYIPSPATVRLINPPRLETELRVHRAATGCALLDGEQVVAEARPADPALDPPAPPTFEAAVLASLHYRGHQSHPHPNCFVCGPDRAPADGLRIFPGPVPQRAVVAAPWTPDASLADITGAVRTEFLWAALDCPGAFSFEWPSDGSVLLGEMTARIDRAARAAAKHVVIGWELGRRGRKHHTGTALFDAAGICIAKARATWLEVPAPV